ncbi:MAG: KpsF/GutQ family sugar-phosphate isomerase [Proteobacteria bacterium]|nr:KpsF/GutQ family sugar-phosphate isomerase [Pseudomonadota bacterium]
MASVLPESTQSSGERSLALARSVLEIEADAVRALISRIDKSFLKALQLILACHGRVVVSGIGKSGHIARKIASTMASTGTPAFFVHAAEAGHGDLGMVRPEDVFICISHSGESAELVAIVPLVKRQGAKLIAITGQAGSTLAREADIHLDAGVAQEACPLNLAPTASTTATLALGDALAVALLDARGFSEADFARSHPGGALGRRLLTHVSDVMRMGDAVPSVPLEASLSAAVLEISRKRMGMTAVVDVSGRIAGIFTDGDLRRTVEKVADLKAARVADVMSTAPRLIGPQALAVEAVELMERHKINQLLVAGDDGLLVGALDMHDLFRAKVV